MMSEREQIYHFGLELDKLCERFSQEYELSNASAVGVLKMKADAISLSAREEEIEE